MVTMGGEGPHAAGGVRVMSINVGRTRPLRVADALSVESGIVKRSISNEAKPIAVEVRKWASRAMSRRTRACRAAGINPSRASPCMGDSLDAARASPLARASGYRTD